jgi:hypothetical protein
MLSHPPFAASITSCDFLLQAVVSILPQHSHASDRHLAPHLAATLLFSISHHVPNSPLLHSSPALLQPIASAASAILSATSHHQHHHKDGHDHHHNSPHHTASLLLCCLPTSPPHPSLLNFPLSLVQLLVKQTAKVHRPLIILFGKLCCEYSADGVR